jgi:hypothetical protein
MPCQKSERSISEDYPLFFLTVIHSCELYLHSLVATTDTWHAFCKETCFILSQHASMFVGHSSLLCRLLDRLVSDFMPTSVKWSTIRTLECQQLCGTFIFPVSSSSLRNYNIEITTKNHFVLFKLLNFREIFHHEDTFVYIKCHVFILCCGSSHNILLLGAVDLWNYYTDITICCY